MPWTFWLAIVVLAFVAYGTIAKNRWGINLRRVTCPNCGTPAPTFRKPKSSQQMFWGGSTCAKCGTTYDKWGRELGPPKTPT